MCIIFKILNSRLGALCALSQNRLQNYKKYFTRANILLKKCKKMHFSLRRAIILTNFLAYIRNLLYFCPLFRWSGNMCTHEKQYY